MNRMTLNMPSPEYELLDSGEGQKLERFGERVLIRPSTLCVWKRRQNKSVWQSADAIYDHKTGWEYKSKSFDTWNYPLNEKLSLILRLQRSGQIGVFPEHQKYLGYVLEKISAYEKNLGRQIKVLNLFAYTGMASLFAIEKKAHVTHVDNTKIVLNWLHDNLDLNKSNKELARVINEDALAFLRREERRGNIYDIVIADPPSFSRLSKQKSWKLEEVLAEIVNLTYKVANPEQGSIILTSHPFEAGADALLNLLSDEFCEKKVSLVGGVLSLKEASTNRLLPASCYAIAGW
ncbi:MAG: class I SAM-dependent methyltransferase [Bdellovibrionales bacterium]|nr:class I SAM-dependent methyltransferase [Bdellovibrionales bacterium]